MSWWARGCATYPLTALGAPTTASPQCPSQVVAPAPNTPSGLSRTPVSRSRPTTSICAHTHHLRSQLAAAAALRAAHFAPRAAHPTQHTGKSQSAPRPHRRPHTLSAQYPRPAAGQQRNKHDAAGHRVVPSDTARSSHLREYHAHAVLGTSAAAAPPAPPP
jgi:hypothetical protein